MTEERKRGRPSVGEHRLQIRLSDDLVKRLEADAIANERTMAAQIRYILARWYAQQDAGGAAGTPAYNELDGDE